MSLRDSVETPPASIPVRQGELNFSVAMVAAVAAIGGGLFGYDTGVISGAILYIKREFPIDVATEGLIVSAVTVGALAAAMLAGGLADRSVPDGPARLAIDRGSSPFHVRSCAAP